MPRTGSPSVSLAAVPSALPWGVVLGLVVALGACRAREGDRCVCADDCRGDLVCVASGRVLEEGECNPAVGEDADPGVCVPADEAADGDDGGGVAEPFMDLGSKRDFDPGPPPDPDTDTDPERGSGTAGTTDTGASSSSGGTTDSGASSSSDGTTGTAGTTDTAGSSSGGTTDSGGTSSSGGTTAGT